MKKYLVVILLTFVNYPVEAQFQVDWLDYRYFNVGAVVSLDADENGGAFIVVQKNDTVCGYPEVMLVHNTSNGSTSSISHFSFESPCFGQTFHSFLTESDRMYLSYADTSGWILKMDTAFYEIWSIDTGYTCIASDVDRSEKISAYVPQWSEVFCFDSSSNQLWSYSLVYPFPTIIYEIESDQNLRKIIAFEYQDGTQSDGYGIGITCLDSGGQHLWDTMINQQTAQDEDLYVDMTLDNFNNVYVLSKDLNFAGGYITKISPSGNIIGQSEFTPSPFFRPSEIVVDTIHGLLYIAGRTPDSLVLLKYDIQLNPLDTMYFDRIVPDYNVVAVNEWGYMFHLWMSDSNSIFELRLEMYNHLGQMVDVYTYFDSTLFYIIRPQSILFDGLGNTFIACNGLDTNFDDVGLVIKLSNPLNVPDSPPKDISVGVFPNPSSISFQISLSGDKWNSQCNLYSSEGKLISTYFLTEQLSTFSCANLTDGFYIIETIMASGERFTNKLIIQN